MIAFQGGKTSWQQLPFSQHQLQILLPPPQLLWGPSTQSIRLSTSSSNIYPSLDTTAFFYNPFYTYTPVITEAGGILFADCPFKTRSYSLKREVFQIWHKRPSLGWRDLTFTVTSKQVSVGTSESIADHDKMLKCWGTTSPEQKVDFTVKIFCRNSWTAEAYLGCSLKLCFKASTHSWFTEMFVSDVASSSQLILSFQSFKIRSNSTYLIQPLQEKNNFCTSVFCEFFTYCVFLSVKASQ